MLPVFFIRSQGLRKLYCGLFTSMLESWGLTQLEADILLFLANNPEYDTARDIVEVRHLAKSHVSAGIEALAAAACWSVRSGQATGRPSISA